MYNESNLNKNVAIDIKIKKLADKIHLQLSKNALSGLDNEDKEKIYEMMVEVAESEERTSNSMVCLLKNHIIKEKISENGEEMKFVWVYYKKNIWGLWLGRESAHFESLRKDEVDIPTTTCGGGYPTVRIFGFPVLLHVLMQGMFTDDISKDTKVVNHMVVEYKKVECGNGTRDYRLRGKKGTEFSSQCYERVSTQDNIKHAKAVDKYGLTSLQVSVKDVVDIKNCKDIKPVKSIFDIPEVKHKLEIFCDITRKIKSCALKDIFGVEDDVEIIASEMSYKNWIILSDRNLKETVNSNSYLSENDRNSFNNAYDIIDKAFKERIDKNAEAFLALKKDSPDRVDYREYRKDA